VQLDTYEIVLEAQEHADALILERTANGFEPIGTLGAPPVGIFPRVLVGTWPEAGATLSLSDLELEISDSFGRVLQSRVAHLDFKRDAPLGDLLIEVQFLDRKAALYRRDSGELACLIFGPSRYDIQEDPLGRDVLGFSGPPYFLFGEAADDDRVELRGVTTWRAGDAYLAASGRRRILVYQETRLGWRRPHVVTLGRKPSRSRVFSRHSLPRRVTDDRDDGETCLGVGERASCRFRQGGCS
jgi:hypothetical protein